jgi:hypothetical protein
MVRYIRKYERNLTKDFTITISAGTVIDTTSTAQVSSAEPEQGTCPLDVTLTSAHFPTITGGSALAHHAIGVVSARCNATYTITSGALYAKAWKNNNLVGTQAQSNATWLTNYYWTWYTDSFDSVAVGDRLEMGMWETDSTTGHTADYKTIGLIVVPSRVIPNGYVYGKTLITDLVFGNWVNFPTLSAGNPSVYSTNYPYLYIDETGFSTNRMGLFAAETNIIKATSFQSGEGIFRNYRPDGAGANQDLASSHMQSSSGYPKYKRNAIPCTITGKLVYL